MLGQILFVPLFKILVISYNLPSLSYQSIIFEYPNRSILLSVATASIIWILLFRYAPLSVQLMYLPLVIVFSFQVNSALFQSSYLRQLHLMTFRPELCASVYPWDFIDNVATSYTNSFSSLYFNYSIFGFVWSYPYKLLYVNESYVPIYNFLRDFSSLLS